MSCNKEQTMFWDTKIPGLGLRITKNGTKSFILQSRLHGKTIRLTIGPAKTWSIEEAQIQARNLLVSIDKGIDPRVEKNILKKSANQTLLTAWQDYIKSRKSRWGARHLHDHIDMSRDGGEIITRGLQKGRSNIKEAGFLRPLLDLTFNQLDREKIILWIEKESVSRPMRTRLGLTMFKAFIRWASNHTIYGTLLKDQFICDQLIRELPLPIARNDCLQKEQLRKWFALVQEIKNPVISAYLQCLLLTGARREELASIKWSNVDIQWHTISIRDKVDEKRLIPLTPYVKDLISSLPKFNEFVFFSERSKSGHIKEPRLALDAALYQSGLPKLTIHGLRRSFGTLAEWVECPTGISAQIMGHKPSALAEKHYRKRPIDLLRKWHTQIERFILKEAEI